MRFADAFQTALVEYDPMSAEAAFAALRMLPAVKGPGLSQGDAIQVVTQLSVLRNQVVDVARFALFTKTAQLSEVVTPITEKQIAEVGDWPAITGGAVIPIAGGDDLRNAQPGGVGLPKSWGSDLALSLDRLMQKIADAEKGPNIPVGFSEAQKSFALALPIVAVIVAGVAVATIASVSAWRYLDPSTRLAITQVKEAGQNYRDRIQVFNDSGKMPPPSDAEIQAKAIVAQLSGERRKHDWIYGAGIGGGVTAFVLAAAYIGSVR